MTPTTDARYCRSPKTSLRNASGVVWLLVLGHAGSWSVVCRWRRQGRGETGREGSEGNDGRIEERMEWMRVERTFVVAAVAGGKTSSTPTYY